MGAPLVSLQVMPVVIAWLAGDAALTSLLARNGTGGPAIYNDVPTGAAFPYLVVGDATETAFHTLGAKSGSWGGRVSLETRAVSRYRGDKEAMRIIDATKQRLEASDLPLPFPRFMVEFEGSHPYSSVEGGVVTRFLAAIFAVTVHESD
jgi:Protein of unknown function (DUF3168)